MKIINLVEDTKGKEVCQYEHGLSFYIETKRHKLLCDTGASEMILENAKALGVDLSEVDTIVLSHGHYDHTGGVMAYIRQRMEQNPEALPQIYLQKTAGADYYNLRDEKEKYIGIDKEILKLPTLHLLEGNLVIDEELSLFSGITGTELRPAGNGLLKKKVGDSFVQDTFEHEQCLVISEEERNVLLSGCAHNGILNILDRYRELYQNYPDFIISGFHLMKRGEYTKEERRVIRKTAEALSRIPSEFYTGHCTGEEAYEIMKPIMGEQLHYVHSGETVPVKWRD